MDKKIEKKNSKKKLKQHIVRTRLLFTLTGLATILLISTIYAWFTTNRNVSISNLKGTLEVAESLEISLDAENWSQKINLDEVNLKNDSYAGNTNLEPVELIPVSTDGEAKIKNGATDTAVTYLPMYRGTYTSSKGLEDIKICDEAEKVSTETDYPGYFAFDIFLRNLSKDNEEDILQLNYNSFASVLKNKYIRETKVNNIVTNTATYTGNAESGLQNTIRVGFMLYNKEAEATDTQASVLQKTGLKSDDIPEGFAVKSVSIWEPNSNDHVDYVVTNNNKITNYSAGQNFTSTSKFFTKTLNRTAVGQTIKKIYDWADTNTYFSKPTTNQTTKKSEIDYRISEKIVDLKQVNGTDYFKIMPNKISRIRVYVWLEGQDVDCVNYASYGGGIELNIGLVKDANAADVKETPILVSTVATKSAATNSYSGYVAGEIIEITTTYSQAVYGTSTAEDITAETAPKLKVRFGTGTAKEATFYSISADKKEIKYKYTVQSGDTGELSIDSIVGTVYSADGDEEDVTDVGLTEEVAVSSTWTQNRNKITYNSYVTNGTVTLEVGSAVTGYSVTAFGTTYGDGSWYVLGAEDGKLLITTGANVKTASGSSTVTLSGQNGYVTGVETLNSIAANYKNSTLADSARSINVDDINRVTGYNPETARYGSGDVYEYGNEVTYTLNSSDSKIYYQGTIRPTSDTPSSNTSFTYWTGSTWKTLASGESSTPIKSTLYRYYPETLSDDSSGMLSGIVTTSSAYTMLFADTSKSNKYYWLGSRCECAYSGHAFFGMRKVIMGDVSYSYSYYSYGDAYSPTSGVRPAVSLKSDIQVSSSGAISN